MHFFNMNKKIKIAMVAVVAAVAGTGVYSSQKNNVMSDIALANVEALAQGEGGDYGSPVWTLYYRGDGGYNCTKPGNQICFSN